MKLFGFEITRTNKQNGQLAQPSTWHSHWANSWWWPVIREPFTGAWQRNMEIRPENVLQHSAVFACITLISSDVSKLGIRLVEQDEDGIWSEVKKNSPFHSVLRKPNRHQTRIQFFDTWVSSKLIHGNTYVLKERDERGVVVRLYVLDPTRIKVLVAPDSSVFYELHQDDLTGLQEDKIIVPASEMIHDRMNHFGSQLMGVSPISACGLAAMQGLAIQNNSKRFFDQGSMPSGILTAPGFISEEAAARLKEGWQQNYTGVNGIGKVAVLGDGLKFERMFMSAVDSQLIEQLKWTAEIICTAFHVPPYMIGVGPMPSYNNVEALNMQYYQQCLQKLIEDIELLLDEGLGLTSVEGKTYGVEFDLDSLLRMDTSTKVQAARDAIGAGFMKPNEARAKFDMKPVEGGDTPYLQQQNYSLFALNKRDKSDAPFGQTNNNSSDDDGEEPDNAERSRSLDVVPTVAEVLRRVTYQRAIASNS